MVQKAKIHFFSDSSEFEQFKNDFDLRDMLIDEDKNVGKFITPYEKPYKRRVFAISFKKIMSLISGKKYEKYICKALRKINEFDVIDFKKNFRGYGKFFVLKYKNEFYIITFSDEYGYTMPIESMIPIEKYGIKYYNNVKKNIEDKSKFGDSFRYPVTIDYAKRNLHLCDKKIIITKELLDYNDEDCDEAELVLSIAENKIVIRIGTYDYEHNIYYKNIVIRCKDALNKTTYETIKSLM